MSLTIGPGFSIGPGFAVSSISSTVDIAYLVVAGGGSGGGGNYGGGGGGGGGVLAGVATLTIGTTYTINVGLGGANAAAGSVGNNGKESVIGATI